MNNDVLTEILLHLPIQSLMRLRVVCKFWGGVIDSSYFQKLHSRNNNKSDDTVCLEVILSTGGGIRVQHNTKSLMSYDTDHLKGLGLIIPYRDDDRVSVYGPVKGLISIYCAKGSWRILDIFPCKQLRVPIAICNPFLGQLKLLPVIPFTSFNFSCTIPRRSVAIGYDEDDLKVVQLSWCYTHSHLHAHLYSRNTNSWRELAVDEEVGEFTIDPIKSACEYGHFAHWHVYFIPDSVSKISFDMKNEVFSTIKLDIGLPDGVLKPDLVWSPIFAEDEHSFRRFHLDDKLVHIYETRSDGSKLSWNYVTSVKIPKRIEIIPRWRTGFIVIENLTGAAVVYDYCERKFICKLPKGLWIAGRGSFESLEKVI